MEKRRLKTIESNERQLANMELSIKVNQTVRVPASAYPDDEAPEEGYWEGKTVNTKKGGTGDIGIKIPGEDTFTVSMAVAKGWLIW